MKQHYLRVGYWASVSYFDFHFGMMLDALQSVGVEQDTIVLVSGDVRPQHPLPIVTILNDLATTESVCTPLASTARLASGGTKHVGEKRAGRA